jgi:hypothetical protein
MGILIRQPGLGWAWAHLQNQVKNISGWVTARLNAKRISPTQLFQDELVCSLRSERLVIALDDINRNHCKYILRYFSQGLS